MTFSEYKKEVIQQLELYFNCEVHTYSDSNRFVDIFETERIIICFINQSHYKMVLDLKEPYEKLRYSLNGVIDEHSNYKDIKIMIRRIEEDYLDNTIRRK